MNTESRKATLTTRVKSSISELERVDTTKRERQNSNFGSIPPLYASLVSFAFCVTQMLSFVFHNVTLP